MISKMEVRRDLRALSLCDMGSACITPRSTKGPRPKHPVSEGLMTLAEDKRPEANLVIGLSQYALQHHQRVIIYVGRVLVSHRWHSLTVLPNSQIKRQGIPKPGEIINCDKHRVRLLVGRCSNYQIIRETRCPSWSYDLSECEFDIMIWGWPILGV